MENDQQIIAGIFDQVIFLMVAAAFIVGALVVGLVIYAATVERRGEYGILKAIGARNGVLYRVVMSQAAVARALALAWDFASCGWMAGYERPAPIPGCYRTNSDHPYPGGRVRHGSRGALVPARAVPAWHPLRSSGGKRCSASRSLIWSRTRHAS
jgi:hypothetical protein